MSYYNNFTQESNSSSDSDLDHNDLKSELRRALMNNPRATKVEWIEITDDHCDLFTFGIINENEIIEQCNKCKSVFLSEHLQYFIINLNCVYLGCPGCKCDYNAENFIIGKAKYIVNHSSIYKKTE